MRLKMPLAIRAFDIYGLSEIAGRAWPANVRNRQACTCRRISSILKLSIRSPGNSCRMGEEGELVFTCIGKEALPLIRYRTRDIASLTHETCKCGRTPGSHDETQGQDGRHAYHPRNQRIPPLR